PRFYPVMLSLATLCSFIFFFSFSSYSHHLDLHSFPTRRSSDLTFLKASHSFRNRLLVICKNAYLFATMIMTSVSSPFSCKSQKADRKSGSAGMPRPISYAVFCLKKKTNKSRARPKRCKSYARRG